MTGALLRAAGVEPRAYRALVSTFWTLAQRSPPAVGTPGKDGTHSWRGMLFFYGVFGCFYAFPAFGRYIEQPAFGVLVCTGTFVVVGLVVVSEFATVVVAPGDDEVLFHRPVSAATYLAARLTVAAGYACAIAGAFGAASWVAGTIRWRSPAFLLLFPASLAATAVFALVVSFALYRVALRFLGGERLRGLVTYAVALASVGIAFAPQLLLPRIGSTAALDAARALRWFPPAWFAAIPETLEGTPGALGLASLGLGALAVSAWLLVAALSRGLLRDLLALLGQTAHERRGEAAPALPPRRLARWLGGIRSPEGRAGYLLALGATRHRTSVARTLPTLVLPFLFLFLWTRDAREGTAAMLPVTMLGLAAGTLVQTSVHHDHHAASWIYGVAPVRRYGRFLLGVIAALVLRRVAPVFLALLAVSMAMGVSAWGSLAAFAASLLAVPATAVFLRHPPFSVPWNVMDQARAVAGLLLSLGVIGAAVYLFSLAGPRAPWVGAALAVGAASAAALLTRLVARSFDANPPPPFPR